MTWANAQHVVDVAHASESMPIGRFLRLAESNDGAARSDHVAPASPVTSSPLATDMPWTTTVSSADESR